VNADPLAHRVARVTAPDEGRDASRFQTRDADMALARMLDELGDP
jgi:hypothetical protein